MQASFILLKLGQSFDVRRQLIVSWFLSSFKGQYKDAIRNKMISTSIYKNHLFLMAKPLKQIKRAWLSFANKSVNSLPFDNNMRHACFHCNWHVTWFWHNCVCFSYKSTERNWKQKFSFKFSCLQRFMYSHRFKRKIIPPSTDNLFY